MKLMNNLVLCKLKKKTNQYKTKGGLILMSDGFDMDQFHNANINRVFEVVQTPDKLMYEKEAGWETEMELKPGDEIWVGSTEADNAKKTQVDEEEYYLINYYHIRLAKRILKDRVFSYSAKGGNYIVEDDVSYEIIPLNGNIVCEEVEKEHKALNHTVKKIDKTKAKVLYIGKQNSAYFYGGKKRFPECAIELKKGDIIIKNPYYHRHLESDKFLWFNGKRLLTMQKRYIDAVV